MNLRRTFHSGRRRHLLLPCLILLVFAFGIAPTQVAQAATINVPCNVTNLFAAINIANTNSATDTLNLAPGCTYTLPAELLITADGGNRLTIEGNGAILSGNFAVRVLQNSGGRLNLNAITVSNGATTDNLGGGGILNSFGTLTLNNSTVSGNTANSAGGGIVNNGGTALITNSSVSNNTASDSGGGGILNIGRANLTLNNSSVSNNTAVDGTSLGNSPGGGIFNFSGTLTLNNSTVSSNTAVHGGGGIYNSGTLTLNNSTVSGNTTDENGGGIYNDFSRTATLTNSTIVGNTAALDGGGIFNDGTALVSNGTIANNNRAGIYNNFSNGSLTVITSTVAGNFEGVVLESNSDLTLANSILANNGVDCSGILAAIFPVGGNLIENDLCGFPGELSGDPLLGGLTGSPAYFPLLPGSPAIDAGNNSFCLSTDQRGAARPFDGDGDGTARCDLGSYESDIVAPAITPEPVPPTATATPAPPAFTPEPVPPTATATSAPPTATATPIAPGATETDPPPPYTPRCEDENSVVDGVVRASIPDALDDEIYCRALYANGMPVQSLGGDLYSAGGIDNQGVIDLGVMQAVDVFSPVGLISFEGGIEICLKGTGTLLFMAASGAPRVPVLVSSHVIDDFPGFACATLFEPGTLVLVRNAPQ